jgi:hypothetical protein
LDLLVYGLFARERQIVVSARRALRVQATNSQAGFEVTTDGVGVLGHAGAGSLRELVDRLGLPSALGWGTSRGRRRRHPDAAVLGTWRC